MKKWLYPLLSAVISIVLFTSSITIGERLDRSDGGYGGLAIILMSWIFLVGIVLPALSFVYSRRCLVGQKFRILFTLYHSLLVMLPYGVIFLQDDETILYVILGFVWCEIWALPGLYKRKDPDPTPETN